MKYFALISLVAFGLVACQSDNLLRPTAVPYSIAQSMNAGIQSICPAPAAGIVSWWRGDGNANDASGSNPGTLASGTTFAAGQIGSGFNMDGTDDDVLIGTKSSLNVGLGAGMTIDAWIHPEGPGSSNFGSGPILEYFNGVHFWQAQGTDGLYANLVDNTGFGSVVNFQGVTPNVWNHVAVTYNKATGLATLYVDGASIGSSNIGTRTLQTSTELHVGNRPAGSFGLPTTSFKGRLDDVQVYNRALTLAEIQAIYTRGHTGACNLVANAGAAVLGNEGTSVSFDGSASTGQSGATFDWDFGDGSPHGTGATPGHTYKDNGVYPVTLSLNDGSGTSVAPTTATISNIVPTVTLTLQTVPPIHVGQNFVLRAGFHDVGVNDGPWSYKFFRGTTPLQQGTKPAQPPPGVTQAVTLKVNTAGTFTFKLQMTDKDGGVGSKSLQVQVVP